MNFLKLLFFIPFVMGYNPQIFTEYIELSALSEIKVIEQHYEKTDFPCSTNGQYRSSQRPKNVNKLKVGDIDIVGAIGDSLTAGFAAEAESLTQIFIESRGVSWSVGGKDSWEGGIRTFPNIVKKYNPNLKGMSINSTNARDPSGIQGYNAAITGSIAQDIPDQATVLYDLLYEDDVNWKHINIFIGGNDLCDVCNGQEAQLPTNYINYIHEALIILSDIPRTFVSVVNVINVLKLNMFATGLCPYLHMLECPCITGSKEDRTIVTQTVDKYHQLVRDMIDTFPVSEDFTVVLQPFMEYVEFKEEPERDLLSPDCFHFTQMTHSSAGLYLWNNVLEPIGQKTNNWNMSNAIICPKEDSFLQTRENFIDTQ